MEQMQRSRDRLDHKSFGHDHSTKLHILDAHECVLEQPQEKIQQHQWTYKISTT